MAFSQLLGAFSVIVNQYTSISSFAAVIARLSGFIETAEAMRTKGQSIVVHEEPGRVAYQGLTLRAGDGSRLLSDLSVSIPRGMRVLVTGPNEAGRLGLFLATAGMWSGGEGGVVRPVRDAIFFVPQRPYLPPGTLRQALVGPEREQDMSDERVLAALDVCGLASVLERAGGLHVERDWPKTLLLGEQQQLVFVRLLLAQPGFAMLDRVSSALGASQVEQWLRRLTENRISYINLDQAAYSMELYDAILEIHNDGSWKWQQVPYSPAAAMN